MDWGRKEIYNVHVAENGWTDIGYHFIIKRDGVMEQGRPIEMVGAHTKGWNAKSVGICLIGGMSEDGGSEFNFTDEQMRTLSVIVYSLRKAYSVEWENINGHNEFSDKDCPCFNVKSWFQNTPNVSS
jgi:N-acetyl-anhydromuramyl-L-alanine amidase AmpD